MSLDPQHPLEEGGRRPRTLFWGVLVLMAGVAAWLLFWPRHPGSGSQSGPPPTESAALGMRAVTLYFGDADGRTLLTERREVPAGPALESRVEACMQALVEGPEQQGAVRTLPAGTRLRQTFYDDDSATLYLDFDPELVTRHPGGSAAEYFTLSSIVRTLGTNFPEVARVQILVDGQPIESLAGHFDVSKPIEIATWQ